MVRSVFGDAIDYNKVKIHNEEYMWFGMQDAKTAMAPDGEIYFSQAGYKEDFSRESVVDRWWLIHEIVHVWQAQLGYSVRLNGAMLFPGRVVGDVYSYELTNADGSIPRLQDFNMEQQGDLIADYFLIHTGLVNKRHKGGAH